MGKMQFGMTFDSFMIAESLNKKIVRIHFGETTSSYCVPSVTETQYKKITMKERGSTDGSNKRNYLSKEDM